MNRNRLLTGIFAILSCASLLAASRPILTGLSPTSVVAGDSGAMVIITGAGFSRSDVVRIDGVPVKAEALDDLHFVVTLSSSDLAIPRAMSLSVDRAGSAVSLAPLTLQVLPNAPSIRAVNPSTVAAGSEDIAVRVSGSNFASNAAVQVNGVARPTVFIDSTQLVATVSRADLLDSGFTRITVANPNSEASTAVPLLVVPALRPAIALVAPHSIVAGSSPGPLSIAGAGFLEGARVEVDGVPLSTHFIDSRHLTASIGAQDVVTPGTMTLTVVNPGNLVSQAIPIVVTAAAVPAIASVIPSLPLVPGKAAAIGVTGENFGPSSTVEVNGAGRPTTFVDERHLTASLFAADVVAATTLRVAVVNAGQRGGISEASLLAVAASDAPVIRSISPASVFAGSATAKIVVDGANFTERDVVLVGGTPRVTEFFNNRRLVVSLQPGDLTDASLLALTVRNEGGAGSAPALLNVVRPNAPIITSLEPPRARLRGENVSVTINGSNFTDDSIVALDGVPQVSRWVSPGQIIVDVPRIELSTPREIAISVITSRGNPSPAVRLPVTVTPPSISEVTFSSDRPNLDSLFLIVSGQGFTSEAAVSVNGHSRDSRFDAATGRLVVALQPEDLEALRTVTVSVPGAGETSSNIDMALGFRHPPAAGGSASAVAGSSSTIN